MSNSFELFQIPQTGVQEPELIASGIARTDGSVPIRRPADMKISNFGALGVGNRISTDYTRTDNMVFPAKGNSEDWAAMTQDTGVGQNVAGRGVTVVHNPYLVGSTVKFARDDKFIRVSHSD